MVRIIKESNGNVEDLCLRHLDWLQIFTIAKINGYSIYKKPIDFWDKEDSQIMCVILLIYLSNRDHDYYDINTFNGRGCSIANLYQIIKLNHVNMIKEFLGFCSGQPFWTVLEN